MPKRQRRQPAAPTVADAKRETDRLVHNVFGVDAAGICRDAGEALQKLRPRSLSAGHQPLAVSQYLPQVVLAVALITIVFDISGVHVLLVMFSCALVLYVYETSGRHDRTESPS